MTTLGEHQAAQTGEYLSRMQPSLDGFYTSPLRRAKETAAIIGSKLSKTPEVKNGIQEVEGLEVVALTVLETLSIFDFVEDYLDAHAGKPIHWPIQGRVSKAIIEMVEAHPNQRIVAVAHAGTISSVLAWAFPEQRLQWWTTLVGNCSLTRLRVDGAQIELLSVNETQHLVAEITTVQPPDRAVQVTKQVMKTVKPTAKAPNAK
ncbi:MAG: histidine phosphatase family protein [Anaerolineae bacterium]|nr:histidine phosphatase family protein [Anaerolineae bacterium]